MFMMCLFTSFFTKEIGHKEAKIHMILKEL